MLKQLNEIKKIDENKNKVELQNLINFDGYQLILRLGMFLLSGENKMECSDEENIKILELKINVLLESKNFNDQSPIKQNAFMMGKHLFEHVFN